MNAITDLAGTTILVADDNPQNVQVLEAMIRDFGCRVRVAMDGEAALRSIEREAPDVVLLDVHMPKVDGYEVCSQLKADERWRDIPVLFISAMNEEFNKVKAFDVGAVDYILKPIQFEELRARISVHLRLAQQNVQLTRQAQEMSELVQSMQGREGRVIELKREINALSAELGRDAPYDEVKA